MKMFNEYFGGGMSGIDLSGITSGRLYYIILSKLNGVKITNDEISQIVDIFLGFVDNKTLDEVLSTLNIQANYDEMRSLLGVSNLPVIDIKSMYYDSDNNNFVILDDNEVISTLDTNGSFTSQDRIYTVDINTGETTNEQFLSVGEVPDINISKVFQVKSPTSLGNDVYGIFTIINLENYSDRIIIGKLNMETLEIEYICDGKDMNSITLLNKNL